MSTILLLMLSGMLLGYTLHRKKYFIMITERITGFSIYLLLFLLGMSVGINDKVISNFGNIGFTAILLTASALAGSIFLSILVNHFFFRQE